MTWEVLPTAVGGLSTRTSNRPLSVSWGVLLVRNKARQYNAYINGRACREIVRIAAEKGINRIGIAVWKGTGEHEGMFALSVEEYPGQRNPTIASLAVQNGSNGGKFSASALSRAQETGFSYLKLEGQHLVGKFGTKRSPYAKRRHGNKSTKPKEHQDRQDP